RPLEHVIADPVGTGQERRVVITGAGGQLGHALAEAFPGAVALSRADWDVSLPPPLVAAPDLVLHAAAWTDLDGAEDDPQGAAAGDQRGWPTYVGHLAKATRELVERGLPFGRWHLAAEGDCTWADFAEAIFEEAGLECRVRRITTEELGRPAPRPAYSVLRSEHPDAP